MDPITHQEENHNPDLCANCRTYPKISEYPTNLCSGCRTAFIKYPIPRWLRVSLLLVGVLVLYSLFHMSQTIGAAVHFERGEKAFNQKKLITALKEFKKANDILPSSALIKSRIFSTHIMNSEMVEAQMVLDTLIKINPTDNELVEYINSYSVKLKYFYEGDSIFYSKMGNPDFPKDSTMNFLLTYASNNPENGEVRFYLASLNFDLEKYALAKKYVDTSISKGYENSRSYLLAAACERELKNYGEGLKWCDKIMQSNVESIDALSAKAKVYLKKRDMVHALEYIHKALTQDPSHPYSNSVAALYYGMNKDNEKMKKCMEVLKNSGPEGASYIESVENILSGKKSF